MGNKQKKVTNYWWCLYRGTNNWSGFIVAHNENANGQLMATSDFKPILCPKCGAVVWSGITWAGFARLLGKQRLTIEEEIIKRLSGLMSYELHRTMVSFEAVERSANRIKWARPDKDRVIVADHHCSSMVLFETLDDAPNYWPSVTYKQSEGAPF